MSGHVDNAQLDWGRDPVRWELCHAADHGRIMVDLLDHAIIPTRNTTRTVPFVRGRGHFRSYCGLLDTVPLGYFEYFEMVF